MNENQNQRPQIERVVAKEFNDGPNALAVKIMKTTGFRPRFSFEMGRIGQDGRFIHFFPFFVTVKNAVVSYKAINVAALGLLIQQAEEWMHQECQKGEDTIIAEKIDKEERTLTRDKPKQRAGLKELSKRDKAARQALGVAPPEPVMLEDKS
jgi:hypothetical protein